MSCCYLLGGVAPEHVNKGIYISRADDEAVHRRKDYYRYATAAHKPKTHEISDVVGQGIAIYQRFLPSLSL